MPSREIRTSVLRGDATCEGERRTDGRTDRPTERPSGFLRRPEMSLHTAELSFPVDSWLNLPASRESLVRRSINHLGSLNFPSANIFLEFPCCLTFSYVPCCCTFLKLCPPIQRPVAGFGRFQFRFRAFSVSIPIMEICRYIRRFLDFQLEKSPPSCSAGAFENICETVGRL